MNFLNAVFLSMLISFMSSGATAQPSPRMMTRPEYIEKFKMNAVQNMMKSGVPASITLAQAMLESSNGNSELAVNANNHFGIKCHDWKGARYIYDDDKKGECFRKYNHVLESYDDHSVFLRTRQRYAFLFEIPKTDYKAWCYGLKQAGYATAPDYPERLIKIIEDNKLFELDRLNKVESLSKLETPSSSKSAPENRELRRVLFKNDVKYVVASKDDSYLKISRELNLNLWQIHKYNDLPKDARIKEGDIIYLQPKRKSVKEEFHVVKAGETMQSISQAYGIKLKTLYKKNKMEPGERPFTGQKLSLRKKIK